MANRFEQFLNPDAAPKSGNRFEQFVEDKDKDDELIPSLDINASMYDRFETMEEGEDYYKELIFSDDVALPNGQTAQDIVDEGGDPTQGKYRFVYTDPNTGKRETILLQIEICLDLVVSQLLVSNKLYRRVQRKQ